MSISNVLLAVFKTHYVGGSSQTILDNQWKLSTMITAAEPVFQILMTLNFFSVRNFKNKLHSSSKF